MAAQDATSLSRFFRVAVVTGVERAVRIHIDRGDDLNARDEKGQTPLMLSAARNNAAICRLLLAAGADACLRDPLGRDALEIARAAGALDAASVIENTCNPLPTVLNGAVDLMGLEGGKQTASGANNGYDEYPPRSAVLILGPSTTEGAPMPVDDDPSFDLDGWEAEEVRLPPESDTILCLVAAQVQTAIANHYPLDTSADWDDFEAFLPERATPLTRAGDAETRERLRLVLLRAIREGSVPSSAIEDLTRDDHGEPDPDAGALLNMVVNDLGAETDERFEYSAPHESFEVFIAPEEKAGEEEAVADALAFVDELATRRSEPLRLYQRDFQRETLLTAEAEVALGQAMERGIEQALDALAAWPTGVGAALEAARQVAMGAKPLRTVSSGPQVEPVENGAEGEPNYETDVAAEKDAEFASTTADGEAASDEEEADAQIGLDARASTDELAEFCAAAEVLSGMPVCSSKEAPEWEPRRGALGSLGLTRSFLMELAESGLVGETDSAAAFRQAMGTYRRARDRMVVANLKLVYSIAKKYLFSGQPLDDLLQEGNIGLIKAVDRYDWRRGFKFSTYATWWIRQQVGRFVADKSKTIRIPVHVYEKTQRIAQVARAFELRHGHAPTLEEIAAQVELPVRKVEELSRLDMEPLSLDELPNIDGLIAVHAKDLFVSCDPMESVEGAQLGGSIDRLLGTLKAKEEIVLRLRFGLGIQDSMTLEEVGARLEVTRERVRQIEVKALQRLKHPMRFDRFVREIGLTTKPNQRAQAQGDADDGDESEGAEPTEQANATAKKPTPSAHVGARPERRPGSEPTVLDKLLAHVRAVGFAVEETPDGPDRRIWVHITETPDRHSRKIVRKLLELGFEFWPGRGYWR